ncbi:MAG: valine--tRNA ligase, partial [Gammaproteobacteria bacterium]|nr:valine--tRNA ligase [Gammaproteobacteria bacterium]
SFASRVEIAGLPAEHRGHAFQDTVMDALTRYHRMRGDCTLWQPGVDHAGIATQMVVERRLEAEGLSRRELGREEFVRRVWAWKESSGGRIGDQLRRLGASLDFSRDCFTLDEARSRAVREVFVRLHEEGLIYRGQRLVNWDPVLQTALSDLEVVSSEEDGHLWRLRYPLVDGDGAVEVDTTRPETMLGDTGVAVHPDDGRYRQLVGRMVRLPLTGREIPIVADEAVDPEFGTGCVKVTPAHDFTDYEIGRRNGLPAINVLTSRARINDAAPSAFVGLDRFEARKAVVEALVEQGALAGVNKHRHFIPRGDRSQAVLEPFLTDQWYVRAAPLAEPAIAAVEDGRVRFVPENWAATYFEWMRNIEDWCISRQLWWGHRIPAWYGEDGEVFVGRDEAEARLRHKLSDDYPLRRDEDVLDTWFSSALWPFSTLGWPEQTPELKRFYPGTVLVTGFDILFFWVARMIMMGLKFMGDVPFREVYVHGLIRDHEGQKMSKSRGNVIDPLDLIDGVDLDSLVEKRTAGLMQPQLAPAIERATRKQFPEGIPAFGADAVRFSFAAMASTGQDIRYDLDRTAGYRNFCTKLWNAARFVFMQQPGSEGVPPASPGSEGVPPASPGSEGVPPSKNAYLGPADRWIVSRLGKALNATAEALDGYRLDLASRAMYDFVWREYCDWYLELAKIVLAGDDAKAAAAARHTLVRVLEAVLRALHPIMPFITEALWQRTAPLAGTGGESVMIASWPEVDGFPEDPQAEAEIEWLQGF